MGEGLMVLGSGWERGQFLGRDWPPWALTLKNKQLNSLSDHQVDFWQHILESDLMSNRRCCQFCTWWRYSFQGKWEKGWWCPTLAGREANFSGEELPPSTRTLGGGKREKETLTTFLLHFCPAYIEFARTGHYYGVGSSEEEEMAGLPPAKPEMDSTHPKPGASSRSNSSSISVY